MRPLDQPSSNTQPAYESARLQPASESARLLAAPVLVDPPTLAPAGLLSSRSKSRRSLDSDSRSGHRRGWHDTFSGCVSGSSTGSRRPGRPGRTVTGTVLHAPNLPLELQCSKLPISLTAQAAGASWVAGPAGLSRLAALHGLRLGTKPRALPRACASVSAILCPAPAASAPGVFAVHARGPPHPGHRREARLWRRARCEARLWRRRRSLRQLGQPGLHPHHGTLRAEQRHSMRLAVPRLLCRAGGEGGVYH